MTPEPKYEIPCPKAENKEMNKKTATVTIKIKGYKKAKKQTKKMRKEIENLNSSLEKTVEIKKKLL